MSANQSSRALILTILFASFPFLLDPQSNSGRFYEGCCLNRDVLARPTDVSQETVPMTTLLEALNCSTNNKYMRGTDSEAKSMGDPNFLHVAYFFGRFLERQKNPGLTIAIYSSDGKSGWLFDLDFKGSEYDLGNLPDLRKGRKAWRVGEINGGEWSFTRIWYLAQEIGSRPRQKISVDSVKKAKPASCTTI
jgi:hypothetical protein